MSEDQTTKYLQITTLQHERRYQFRGHEDFLEGVGLSGCMQLVFDGQRRQGYFGKKSFGGDYLLPIQNGV